MEKIKDERLIIKNLQNIRVAYITQTVGILGILVYDLITKGLDGMRANPLWIVFMLTTVVFAYLSMNISVEHETNQKSPKKSLYISLVVNLIISTAIVFFVSNTDGYSIKSGLVTGGILFICILVPTAYIYFIRSKQESEHFDE